MHVKQNSEEFAIFFTHFFFMYFVFSFFLHLKNEKPCSRVKRSSYLSFTCASILANNPSLSPSTKCIYKASPRIGECGAKAVPFGITHLADPVNGAAK